MRCIRNPSNSQWCVDDWFTPSEWPIEDVERDAGDQGDTRAADGEGDGWARALKKIPLENRYKMRNRDQYEYQMNSNDTYVLMNWEFSPKKSSVLCFFAKYLNNIIRNNIQILNSRTFISKENLRGGDRSRQRRV